MISVRRSALATSSRRTSAIGESRRSPIVFLPATMPPDQSSTTAAAAAGSAAAGAAIAARPAGAAAALDAAVVTRALRSGRACRAILIELVGRLRRGTVACSMPPSCLLPAAAVVLIDVAVAAGVDVAAVARGDETAIAGTARVAADRRAFVGAGRARRGAVARLVTRLVCAQSSPRCTAVDPQLP